MPTLAVKRLFSSQLLWAISTATPLCWPSLLVVSPSLTREKYLHTGPRTMVSHSQETFRAGLQKGQEPGTPNSQT